MTDCKVCGLVPAERKHFHSDHLCSCTHTTHDHKDELGPCNGLDSYEQPCACPSFVHSQEDLEADAGTIYAQDLPNRPLRAQDVGPLISKEVG